MATRSCWTSRTTGSTPSWSSWGRSDDKADELADLVRRFTEETGSEVAQRLLDDWPAALERFTLVMPRDFKRVLDVRAEAEAEGLDEDQANARIMEVLHG